MTTYGLIGYPLGHSFSRKFFTEKFEKEGIDAQYLNFEIPSIEEFPEIIKNNPELRGLNVTIPYKQQVMQYLDEISEEAKAIGAVNVVRIERPSPQPSPIMGRETMRNAGNKPDGLPIKGEMSEGQRGSSPTMILHPKTCKHTLSLSIALLWGCIRMWMNALPCPTKP